MKKKLLPIVLSVALLMGGCGTTTNTDNVKAQEETTEACTEQQGTLKKPVIYLEGYTGEEVTVELSGVDVTMSYPAMTNNKSWKVKVLGDNKLQVNNKNYRYLFWEGDADVTWSFQKGSCVKGSDTIKFLEGKLTNFGLNEYEIADFITYWAPQMVNNPYNVISFQTSTYTNAAKLTVTPKPNKVLRVFMAYYPSDTMVEMKAQEFKTPTRSGKVVVEWGGTQVDPNTFKSVPVGSAIQTVATTDVDETATEAASENTAATTDTNNNTANTTTEAAAPVAQPPVVQPPVVVDPYAAYGEKAQCAKDWDSSGISNISGKWANLDEGTRAAAWNHWQGHGKVGW